MCVYVCATCQCVCVTCVNTIFFCMYLLYSVCVHVCVPMYVSVTCLYLPAPVSVSCRLKVFSRIVLILRSGLRTRPSDVTNNTTDVTNNTTDMKRGLTQRSSRRAAVRRIGDNKGEGGQQEDKEWYKIFGLPMRPWMEMQLSSSEWVVCIWMDADTLYWWLYHSRVNTALVTIY